ncbi:hypothetical protein KEU06_09420 [Pseudaminobacter sp. 19-2017]|uniref:Uncharacterized protein n=1 Tax=Pseudaminobacter soli (ex Zhang et al. 2022) TaxID=2831468 RepID=A0A942DWQ3_9HYPH|nr:hypothetical protein [Pseudaminobacter soli]MBS3648824.1 hypothetical protein [Pseudaminobacter soli]
MTRKEFDLHGFTAALAAVLGGKDQSNSDHSMTRLSVMTGAVEMSLRTGYGSTWNKVTICPYFPCQQGLNHYEQIKVDSITVTGDRDIAAVAKDVKRRILDGIEPKLEEARARVAARETLKSSVAERAADWQRRFPGLQVKISSDGTGADVYYNRAGRYLNGSMTRDGTLSLQRVSLDGPETSEALLALLTAAPR